MIQVWIDLIEVWIELSVTKVVKSEPTLLLHRGQILINAMHRERLTKAEIHADIREVGYSRIEDVQDLALISQVSGADG